MSKQPTLGSYGFKKGGKFAKKQGKREHHDSSRENSDNDTPLLESHSVIDL